MTQKKYCHTKPGNCCGFLRFETGNRRIGKAVCFMTESIEYISEMKKCPLLRNCENKEAKNEK
jgi:hypothetical protein